MTVGGRLVEERVGQLLSRALYPALYCRERHAKSPRYRPLQFSVSDRVYRLLPAPLACPFLAMTHLPFAFLRRCPDLDVLSHHLIW